MCPTAPRVCSEPGGQKPVLSLSLDLIVKQFKIEYNPGLLLFKRQDVLHPDLAKTRSHENMGLLNSFRIALKVDSTSQHCWWDPFKFKSDKINSKFNKVKATGHPETCGAVLTYDNFRCGHIPWTQEHVFLWNSSTGHPTVPYGSNSRKFVNILSFEGLSLKVLEAS